jgi:hypothetical protein
MRTETRTAPPREDEDKDKDKDNEKEKDPPSAAPMDGMVPMLTAPAPPSKGHNRGRSQGDTSSLSDRISKATERLRSASRGRKDGMRGIKSPPMMAEAPYESIPSHHYKPATTPLPNNGAVPPPVLYDPDVIRSPIEGPRGSHTSTGLHYSEMF